MPIYLAYETAVEAICYLRTREKDTTAWRRPSRKTSIYDAISTNCELKNLITRNTGLIAANAKLTHEVPDEIDALDDLFFLDELTDLTPEEAAERQPENPVAEQDTILSLLTRPLHVLVPAIGRSAHTGALTTHLWSGRIPERSFIEIEPDVYLSTPAFTFLQMATELTLVELVQLAMMLCGFYSASPAFGRTAMGEQDPPLAKIHHAMVGTASVFQIDPACSTRTLGTYLERAKGCAGVKQARAACAIALDHAASHMETALFLLLCLPVRLGGYGIPRPELNPKVVVVQASGAETRYPDLYWRGMSIDVEYNSDAEHSGPSAHYRDSRRMVAIVCNHIKYLSVSTGQLYRAIDLDNAARGLARLLKHRIRNTDNDWKRRRMLLRAAVLPPKELLDGESA